MQENFIKVITDLINTFTNSVAGYDCAGNIPQIPDACYRPLEDFEEKVCFFASLSQKDEIISDIYTPKPNTREFAPWGDVVLVSSNVAFLNRTL